MMERRFAREIGSLEAVFAFVDEFLASEGLRGDHSHDLGLIIEELFTNTVRHAKGSASKVEIGLARAGPLVTMTLRDFDVDPFDVTRAKRFDPAIPISERKAGGMGLHLVRQLADEMRYEYNDRVSTVIVTKRLEP
jgi:serine/threonine-protein kinase RsbW